MKPAPPLPGDRAMEVLPVLPRAPKRRPRK